MKPALLALPLLAALTACGTGLIPPITQDVPDIKVVFPESSTAVSGVVYINTNQFGNLPAVSSIVNSVEAAGDLVYTSLSPLTDLSSVGIYIRPDLYGQNCYNMPGYIVCTGDESANKLQDLPISKGVVVRTKLAGTLLNKAIQSRTGYIGFKVNSGAVLKGDQLNITGIKATIRF